MVSKMTHRPHSYSISDKNAKFITKMAKKGERSASNTLDRILDNYRGMIHQVIHSAHTECSHGSVDPKTNMCRECFTILDKVDVFGEKQDYG